MIETEEISNKLISVILPTFNESGSIQFLISEIHTQLKAYPHEIVVVDDNSPDGTFKLLQAANLSYVRPLLRVENPGLANSIRHGIENAKGDIFVIMDSDFNHNPKYLPFMIQSLSNYDVVLGSRFLYGGRGANRHRHLLSWLFNLVLRVITDGRITDSLYGFYAAHRRAIVNLPYDEIFWGFGDYSIRMLYFLQKQGSCILQVPTVFGARIAGTGHQQIIRTFFSYTASTIKLVLKHGRVNFQSAPESNERH